MSVIVLPIVVCVFIILSNDCDTFRCAWCFLFWVLLLTWQRPCFAAVLAIIMVRSMNFDLEMNDAISLELMNFQFKDYTVVHHMHTNCQQCAWWRQIAIVSSCSHVECRRPYLGVSPAGGAARCWWEGEKRGPKKEPKKGPEREKEKGPL